METNNYPGRCFRHRQPPPHGASPSGEPISDAALEFGRYRVLLRRRQLLVDGVRVELHTRAFDLLAVLLEADGRLVTKAEIYRRVWPGIAVSEGNLKAQIQMLRKALGADAEVIRTEWGRGYRFTGVVRATVAAATPQRPTRALPRASRALFAQNLGPSLRCSFGPVPARRA